jgi:arylsulfatase A-like enzyme
MVRRLLGFGIGLALAFAAPARAERLNVVLVSLCSVRADHTSVYGYARDTTPHLRTFAGESIVFEEAFTPWPKTAPAFAALVTGKFGHSTGVTHVTPNQHLATEHHTLGEVMAKAGYATAAFLSSPALVSTTEIPRGFGLAEELWRSRDWYDLPSTRALEWIRHHRAESPDRPFLVWAHCNHAHYPYRGGGAEPGMYVDDEHYDPKPRVELHPSSEGRLKLPIPADHFAAQQIQRGDIGGVHTLAMLSGRPTELAFYVARYDAGIFGADHAAGELLAGLRDLGLLDSTVVVVVGDHGESLGEHNYYFEHGRFPYDDTTHVPFMIRLPSAARARRIDAPVSTLSLMPTVLDVLGVPPPPGIDGISLRPVLDGAEPHVPVYTESGYHLDFTLSIRDGRWKLIHVPNPIDRTLQRGTEYELYDWRADPGETANMVETNPVEVDRLRTQLDAWAAPWREAAYRRSPALNVAPDDAAKQRLRALGYLADEPTR